jgi:hypothetical protein
MEKHVKFYAEPCETTSGRWQVVGESNGRTFLLDACLSKQAALRAVKLAERTALFAGAAVIA